MKRSQFLLLLGGLLLAACSGPVGLPQATEKVVEPTATSEPAATATSAPTATQEPTAAPTEQPTAQPTSEPTEGSAGGSSLAPDGWTGEFVFSNSPLLAVWYHPGSWMSDKGPGQGWLVYQNNAGCQITDEALAQPPADRQLVQVGDAFFESAPGSDPFTGQPAIWYLLTGPLPDGSPNPYATGPVPALIVTAPQADLEECQALAEAVLATIHAAPR